MRPDPPFPITRSYSLDLDRKLFIQPRHADMQERIDGRSAAGGAAHLADAGPQARSLVGCHFPGDVGLVLVGRHLPTEPSRIRVCRCRWHRRLSLHSAKLMSEDADNREFVHRIDRDDRICFVNAAWLAFAEENGWNTTADRVLGSLIMSQIADAETRHIYRLLIDKARDGSRPARFRYRCDSPDLRRFMEMRISNAGQGQVEFRSRSLRIERREPVRVLDATMRKRSTEILNMCSWCKAVYAQSAWLDLEEAVQRLGILAESALPAISHGICPACSGQMLQAGGPQ